MPKPDSGDPVVDEVEGKEVTKGAEETAAEALRIATEVQDKLNKAPEVETDAAAVLHTPQFREKAKEVTGMTDAQIDFVVATSQAAAADGNAKAALAEVKGRNPVEFAKVEKAVRAELAKYPPEKRGSTELVTKIFYMERGKAMDSKSQERVPSTSIRSGGPTSIGLETEREESSKTLTDEERYVARKMRISETDYLKSKNTKLIHELADKK